MKPTKESASKQIPKTSPTNKKSPRWAWLVILLLPIAFYLPVWGESLQVALIGYEGFCCMPDNWRELERKIGQARNIRFDSNLIIGTGILLAIAVLVLILFALYKYAIPSLRSKKLRQIAQIVVGIIIAPLALLLFSTLMMFIFRNDFYHETRYLPPGGDIYTYVLDWPLLWWYDESMPFDFKKEYKEFYLPPKQPHIITIPPMNYLAVRGHGDPNIEGGEYKQSIELLYAIAFTLKMSKKTNYQIKGYFDYVVPPLEGFWWQDYKQDQKQNQDQAQNQKSDQHQSQNNQPQIIDYSKKDQFNFISVIRLPDFVTHADFDWAVQTATEKKQRNFSRVEFLTYDESLCVQCLHLGSYDDEPATIAAMSQYATEQGYELDIQNPRYHHEIYLSDPRRCQPDKLKTVIRHPIKPLKS